MNKFTHSLIASTIALCTAACGLQVDNDDGTLETIEERAATEYSGKDFFMGIFLGQGEVAAQLPLLWGDCTLADKQAALIESDPEVMAEDVLRLMEQPGNEALHPMLEQAHEALLSGEFEMSTEEQYQFIADLVEQADPGYFESLREAVTSGDRAEIQTTLRAGRELIEGIILVDDTPKPGEDVGAVEVAVAIVLVAVYLVAVVATEVAVWGSLPDQSRIWEEMVVDEIATQFGA